MSRVRVRVMAMLKVRVRGKVRGRVRAGIRVTCALEHAAARAIVLAARVDEAGVGGGGDGVSERSRLAGHVDVVSDVGRTDELPVALVRVRVRVRLGLGLGLGLGCG
mgnify:CR=1 FL=1